MFPQNLFSIYVVKLFFLTYFRMRRVSVSKKRALHIYFVRQTGVSASVIVVRQETRGYRIYVVDITIQRLGSTNNKYTHTHKMKVRIVFTLSIRTFSVTVFAQVRKGKQIKPFPTSSPCEKLQMPWSSRRQTINYIHDKCNNM